MKAAFASIDGKHIAEHFGRCRWFSIFELDEDGYRWLEAREIVETDGESELGRMEARTAAVADCTLLFVSSIGPSAAAQVTRIGVMPLKVEPGSLVLEQIDRLVKLLQGNPPLWLKKAMHRRNPEAAGEEGAG